MPALKIAIQLSGLRLPFRKAVAVAARLGASAVEIDARGELRPDQLGQTALREVRRLLEEHGLRVSAVGFRTRRGYDDSNELDRRVTATKAALRLAADLRAAVVVNQVGRVPEEAGGPGWNQLVETLSDLGRYGHHVGATFAAHTGGCSGPVLRRLIDALGPLAIGADLDPGNLIINGFSPLGAVESLGQHILHVHARDGARDLARGRGLEVPLGRGTADFPALLGALENFGYRGYFTIAREETSDAEQEFGQAVEYLNEIVH
ncbi:MAG: sugar phosphate isomerase/epimerase family protein [Pirellulales bacterium]